MPGPIRVLIVDDAEEDALLLVRELRRNGFEPFYERVDSPQKLQAALEASVWDAVICDYRMPGFDGPSALALVQKMGVDLPFIVVSGLIGEDAAVQMMKAGAHDYLLKDNLVRLVPAIEREMREAEERRELRNAERSRAHLAAIVAYSDDGIISTSADGTILTWNLGAEKIFGYNSSEAQHRPISFFLNSQHKIELATILDRVLRGERVKRVQIVCLSKNGEALDVSLTISAIKNPEKKIVGASIIARDITERKRAEAEREKLLRELQQALSEVKTLSGLLPICASCKKIRDDKGYWQQVEIYVKRHSRAEFTHGFCPDCLRSLYPQFVASDDNGWANDVFPSPATTETPVSERKD